MCRVASPGSEAGGVRVRYLRSRSRVSRVAYSLIRAMADKVRRIASDGLNGANHRERRLHMNTITTKDGVEIFYKDWGKGQPIVFSHGWPLSADDWDTQMLLFVKHGYRVIAHDRRGHGGSTQTYDGHDMDHYADDRPP